MHRGKTKVVNRFFESVTGRNTLLLAAGLSVKLVAQMASFAIIAPTLGTADFGLYISFMAIANVVGPFVDMGTYGLVVRDMNRGVPTADVINENLSLTLSVTPVGVVVFAVISFIVIPSTPLLAGVLIASGMLIGFKTYNLARAVFVGAGTAWKVAVLEIALSALQLIAAYSLKHLDGTISTWALLFLLQNLIIGVFSMVWLRGLYGWPRPTIPTLTWLKARMKEGVHFAIAGSASTLGGEADKMLLPRLAGLEATGLYGAAQRVVTVTAVPISALSASVYNRYFTASAKGGYCEARRMANKIALPIFIYSLVVLLGLWFAAPYATLLFGPQYRDIATAIRLLAFLSMILALQLPFADALTGSGKQSVRTFYQVMALFLNIILNITLVPHLGWLGAAYAALVSQSSYLLALIAYKDRSS